MTQDLAPTEFPNVGTKRVFQPKRTDDLAERCKPWIGKEVTVQSWHCNISMRDRYPDDELVGFIAEFAADVPESELL